MSIKLKFLFGLVTLQVAWIVGTVGLHEARLHRGFVVLLETAPVDPRDLLRGDYLILSYKISRVPARLVAGLGTNHLSTGTPIFVRLVSQGRFHEVESASTLPLETRDGSPVIRGRLSGLTRWRGGEACGSGSGCT